MLAGSRPIRATSDSMKASAKRKRSVRPRSRPRETEPPPQVVVLAAGVGSRMRSTLPKVLHRVGGRTLLDSVLDTARGVSPSRVVAVIGAGREKVESVLA